MDLAVDQTGAGTGRPLRTGWAEIGLRPVTQPAGQASLLEARSCGRIVTEGGALEAVYGRWFPYTGDLWQVWWDKNWRGFLRDRCELYYHAVWSSPSFLTLSYIRSGPQTKPSTLYAATLMLDEIARLRHASAIVCHVSNPRISERVLQRWGWERHCLQWSGRHYIKRFYGSYPLISASWRGRLRLGGRP